ncbi:MAG: hypothetical protein ABIL62_15320 [Planctomycetota bacterium]
MKKEIVFMVAMLVMVLTVGAETAVYDWVKVDTVHSPPVNGAWCHLAFDSARGETVALVAYQAAGRIYLDPPQTWVYDGTDWTRRFPAHSPTPRTSEFGICYDSHREKTVIFGGYRYGRLNDLWE